MLPSLNLNNQSIGKIFLVSTFPHQIPISKHLTSRTVSGQTELQHYQIHPYMDSDCSSCCHQGLQAQRPKSRSLVRKPTFAIIFFWCKNIAFRPHQLHQMIYSFPFIHRETNHINSAYNWGHSTSNCYLFSCVVPCNGCTHIAIYQILASRVLLGVLPWHTTTNCSSCYLNGYRHYDGLEYS